MALSLAQVISLRAEVQNDPQGFGYGPLLAANDYAGILSALTQERPAIRIDRDIVPAYEVFEAIIPSEWATLTANERTRVQTILGMGAIDLRGANTRASFQAAFGPGTTTRANLVALLQRQGTRLEQLGILALTYTELVAALRSQI